jgi:quercetin dioxygenase-like cupin family protein
VEKPIGGLVAPGQGRVVDVVGDRYFFLAEGKDTGGRYALWEALVPPGGGPPPHVHSREHEGFYVLEGQITFTMDGKPAVALPGTSAHTPPGAAHGFRNDGDRPARLLIFIAPAGLEEMFFRVGAPVTDPSAPIRPVDGEQIARLLALAPEYGVELLPPG